MVDDLALGGAHGAVGAHDVLHGDDVELRARELARAALVMHVALIGAVGGAAELGHGGAALRLRVRVGDDRGGDRVLMVSGHGERDVLPAREVRRCRRDLVHGVLARLEGLRQRHAAALVGGELGELDGVGVAVRHGDGVAVRIEDLEGEAGERHGLPGLGVLLHDLDAGADRLVVQDVAQLRAVRHLLG